MKASRAVEEFWRECRASVPGLPLAAPEAWTFGATSAQADALLALVLDGTKTATASSLWDYEHSHDPLPAPGLLNIVLDGDGTPRALLETVSVEIIPFDEVDASHALAEGEGDRSLSSWRQMHERYWRQNSESPRGFAPDMPVVCERLRLLYVSGSSAGRPHADAVRSDAIVERDRRCASDEPSSSRRFR